MSNCWWTDDVICWLSNDRWPCCPSAMFPSVNWDEAARDDLLKSRQWLVVKAYADRCWTPPPASRLSVCLPRWLAVGRCWSCALITCQRSSSKFVSSSSSSSDAWRAKMLRWAVAHRQLTERPRRLMAAQLRCHDHDCTRQFYRCWWSKLILFFSLCTSRISATSSDTINTVLSGEELSISR